MIFSATGILVSTNRFISRGRNLIQFASKSADEKKRGYESIKAALLNFQDLNGHMLVTSRFVVPVSDTKWSADIWGIKLGSTVNSIRCGRIHSDKREDLERIGFDFNPQKSFYGYESIKATLLNYKDLNGHMLVPNKFVVPASDTRWPEEMWGMNLGFVVHDIRGGTSHTDKREDLERIGFDFNPQKITSGYKSIKAALLNYQDLNGHMLVPARFVVPDGDIRWHEETWGMNLGSIVGSIRGGCCHTDHREDLEIIGFDFNPQKINYGYESIKLALLNYQTLNGHMLVPTRFVVPESDVRWDEERWGLNLGFVVRSIRGGCCHVDKREELVRIGFDFNPQKITYGYESIRVALVNYKDLNGHMFVAFKFVVPAGDIRWPEETWGMKVGSVVRDIRRGKSHVKKREDLESIGFNFNPPLGRYGYKTI